MKKSLVYAGILLSSIALSGFAKTNTHHESHYVGKSAALTAVNINSAKASELIQLKGVGHNKAQAIVDYRQQHGNFKSVTELAQVKGIGEKMLQRIERENPGKMVAEQ